MNLMGIALAATEVCDLDSGACILLLVFGLGVFALLYSGRDG